MCRCSITEWLLLFGLLSIACAAPQRSIVSQNSESHVMHNVEIMTIVVFISDVPPTVSAAFSPSAIAAQSLGPLRSTATSSNHSSSTSTSASSSSTIPLPIITSSSLVTEISDGPIQTPTPVATIPVPIPPVVIQTTPSFSSSPSATPTPGLSSSLVPPPPSASIPASSSTATGGTPSLSYPVSTSTPTDKSGAGSEPGSSPGDFPRWAGGVIGGVGFSLVGFVTFCLFIPRKKTKYDAEIRRVEKQPLIHEKGRL